MAAEKAQWTARITQTRGAEDTKNRWNPICGDKAMVRLKAIGSSFLGT